MLVLSRKSLERILIPEFDITITVLTVGQNRVKIGVSAPPEVTITRPDSRRCADAGNNETANPQAGSATHADWSTDLMAISA